MFRMLCNFESPNYREDWDEIIPFIDTAAYRFLFDNIQEFNRDNPHHSLTLDKHMQAAFRYCKDQGYGEMMEGVAAYHDIGKLYIKQYSSTRGENTTNAHYLGHDNYGAYFNVLVV